MQAYENFTAGLPVTKPYETKWSEKGIDITEEEWRVLNILPYKCTLSTKLQAFQYKITHRILGTRVFQKMCRITDDDACTFCQDHAETITHLFIECPVTDTFWQNVVVWLSPELDLADQINHKMILFGVSDSLLKSHLLLIAKYYLFICERGGQIPTVAGVSAMVKVEYDTERFIAKGNKSVFKRYQDKWRPIEGLLGGNA